MVNRIPAEVIKILDLEDASQLPKTVDELNARLSHNKSASPSKIQVFDKGDGKNFILVDVASKQQIEVTRPDPTLKNTIRTKTARNMS
jgi:hypothetical protein